MVYQTEENAFIGAKGSSSHTGRIPYASALVHSARIHPTNIVSKLVPVAVETPTGTFIPSPSDLVLFADNNPSRADNPQQFMPLNTHSKPYNLRANHQDTTGNPVGGNAFYVDGHTDFKTLPRLRLRTINNDADNPCFWY
jgi:hypothetical protein